MHKPSSTNKPTGKRGLALDDRGAPVNGSLLPEASVSRASAPNSARALSYVARRFASRSTCHARFTSDETIAASRANEFEPATSGWHFFILSRYASLISSVVADDDTLRSA